MKNIYIRRINTPENNTEIEATGNQSIFCLSAFLAYVHLEYYLFIVTYQNFSKMPKIIKLLR
jgi:hypothetical protein